MVFRKSPGLSRAPLKATGRASVYTAQAVADFCEVDLKTVHHWADRGKVAHFRTEGRHLRFRRNEVVRFLRAHGYPLPEALVKARPMVALALPPAALEGGSLSIDDLAKRIASRFAVRRHDSGIVAIAHLIADAPDVLVLSLDDPTVRTTAAVAALNADPATSWIAVAVVGSLPPPGLTPADERDHAADAGRGADVTLAVSEIAKLPGELARALAVVT